MSRRRTTYWPTQSYRLRVKDMVGPQLDRERIESGEEGLGEGEFCHDEMLKQITVFQDAMYCTIQYLSSK